MRSKAPLCIAAGVLVLVSACGGGEEKAADSAPAAATPEAAALAAIPEPVQLADSDVEHWLAAAGEIKALGVKLQDERTDSPSDFSATMNAWQANTEVMAILRKHEFDLTRFHRVTYSIYMAAAAEGVSQQEAEMKDAKQKMEAMKSQMPAAAYEQMKKAQEQGDSMVKSIMNQPAGNVELVKRYRDRIEAIAKD